MTRKRVGQGLVEAFSEECPTCHGRGFILHDEPTVSTTSADPYAAKGGDPFIKANGAKRTSRKSSSKSGDEGSARHHAEQEASASPSPSTGSSPEVKAKLAAIAAAAVSRHEDADDGEGHTEKREAESESDEN
jgi:ribonuclease E